MKINKYLCLICSALIYTNTVNAVELCGNLNQGELVFGKTLAGDKVYLNDNEINVDENGLFLLAFDRDEKNKQKLSIISADNLVKNFEFAINPTEWNIQSITGVPPRKVTPSDSDLLAIEKENKLLKQALKTLNNEIFWHQSFINPVEGRISGEFGGQRIMNKIPKSPHKGMDIAAKEGTPIKASGSGNVVLAYPDLFYSGNVVVIDHGFGLQTIYAHLKEMNVKLGDKVNQGDIIGLVGKTGRATGPHLHFGVSLRNMRFNPTSLLNMNSNLQKCFTLSSK